MNIKIKSLNSDQTINLSFDDEKYFNKIFIQISEAVIDPNNIKTVVYSYNGVDKIFPALFLKNSYIIATKIEYDDIIYAESN